MWACRCREPNSANFYDMDNLGATGPLSFLTVRQESAGGADPDHLVVQVEPRVRRPEGLEKRRASRTQGWLAIRGQRQE